MLQRHWIYPDCEQNTRVTHRNLSFQMRWISELRIGFPRLSFRDLIEGADACMATSALTGFSCTVHCSGLGTIHLAGQNSIFLRPFHLIQVLRWKILLLKTGRQLIENLWLWQLKQGRERLENSSLCKLYLSYCLSLSRWSKLYYCRMKKKLKPKPRLHFQDCDQWAKCSAHVSSEG